MFFEPPEGQTDSFRFVYYPPGIDHDEDHFTDLDNDGFLRAGVVLVPKETKSLVENFLSEILEIKEFGIPLEMDIGSAIEKRLDKIENSTKSSKYLRSKFKHDRYWGHYIYHLILEKFAKLIGVKKIDLTSINYDIKLEDKIRNIRFDYISQFEWHEYRKISPLKGSLEFIISTVIENHESHFKLGKVNELSQKIMKDESPFINCNRKQCKYENGEPKVIWESESAITELNRGYTSDGLLPHGLPTKMMGGKEYIVYPRAKIEELNCICSSERKYCRLVKNELWVTENKIFNSKTIEVRYNYKDYRNYELNIDEQAQKLINEFYSDIMADILPKKQAQVASKILYNEKLNNAERHSKFLLSNKLDDLERVVSYWPDLESLRKKVNLRKRKK